MNYWIFQSVPDRYDLRDESNLHSNMDGWWYATRYRKKMIPGDRVFFWMGGSAEFRGIYGVGEIASEPYLDGDSHKVKVHVTKRLSHHISADEIKANTKLQNLMILKIAIGSNFLVNDSEGKELDKLTNGGS
ncbi:EVE domain-containing protein [Pseudoalteromonas maricaloris]|uniref:EVE domain-containing protein n=1 Tax=Pseudoalteromonas maricaloris TaxID=184924 RepID=UPI003C1D0EEC